MRFLRRATPDVDPSFAAACAAVDEAQRALLAAIPTSRDAGVPLAEALAAMGAALDRAARALETWDDPARDRCRAAVADARDEAAKLRLGSEKLGFEALNARAGDVLHPLEVFAEIERNILRSQRRERKNLE